MESWFTSEANSEFKFGQGVFLNFGEDGEGFMELEDKFPTLSEKSVSILVPTQRMEFFSQVKDWKHVLYNLLVENYNNPNGSSLIRPIRREGKDGFTFNGEMNPDKKIAELYAAHIRQASLELEDPSCVFVHDLYKHYLRSAQQLMAKYFIKVDKLVYLYYDVPLFVPGETLEQAQARLKLLETKQRRSKKHEEDLED